MRDVTENYLAQVKSCARQFGFRVDVYGNSAEEPDTLLLSDIISIDITRSASDQLQIGACMSSKLTLQTRATTLLNGRGKKVVVYYRCTAPLLGWDKLGTFYVDECVTEQGITAVTAYDMMSRLDKRVSWVDTSHATAPTFPCTMQAMLEYLCDRAGVNTDFVCQDITVENAPDGYTARELISYIAASHGGNAYFSANEILKIRTYEQTSEVIQYGECYSMEAASDSGYTVKGILFDRGGDDKIYIDGTSSEYDEDADGVVQAFNPFATVGIAEYAWSKLGGLSCSAVSIEMPAVNILEPGDVFTIQSSDGTEKTAIVMEQSFSVSCTGGFVETISCSAESKNQTRNAENRAEAMEKASKQSGSSISGYEYLSDTSVKFNGTTYTIEKDSATGLISKISDSYNHEFKPTLNSGIADVALHNAVFWAVAMHSGLGEVPEKVLFNGLDGAWEYSGGLTGLSKVVGVEQNYSGVTFDGYSSGVKVLRLEKAFRLADFEDNYTDAVIIRSNERINLSGYKKLRVLAVAFKNESMTGRVYFKPGEVAAAHQKQSYDFSGWSLVGECKILSTNYSSPGTAQWYDIDVSDINGSQYLNFAVFHGSEMYSNSVYFDIHKMILIP